MVDEDLNLAEDEILIKDETGELKVLAGKDIKDYGESEKKAVKTKPESSLVFDAEDEKEIDGLKKLIPTATPPPINFDQVIDEIIKKSQINFKNEDLRKKFTSIISSRLKDIRDKLETKKALMHPLEFGGLGLEEEEATKICAILEEKFQTLSDKARLLTGEQDEKEIILKKPEKPLPTIKTPKLVFEPKVKEAESETKKLQTSVVKGVETPQAKVEIHRSIEPKAEEKKVEEIKEVDEKKVKYSPKLIGPIEELENLNLTDFKRLAQNPREAIEKILDKIKLLEKESFTQRIKAIKAWQSSPLNQLYLEIGRQCLEQAGADLDQIIAQRRSANQVYLSSEELEAIMDLNKKLRQHQ